MGKSFKALAFAATSGLVLTIVSVFVVDEESVFMFTWGYPLPYFEKLYPDAIDFNGTAHIGYYIWWSEAILDLAFWFLLSVAVVGAVSLALRRLKPVTRSGTLPATTPQ